MKLSGNLRAVLKRCIHHLLFGLWLYAHPEQSSGQMKAVDEVFYSLEVEV